MGNDLDRGGSRSDEPPPLATVRRLHLDDVDGSGVTATDEWYETERLTGHITGGARSASTVNQPGSSQAAPPVILDWRHAPAAPPPTALQRLGRTLAARPRRRGPRDSDLAPARTRGAQPVSVLAAASQIAPPTIEPEEGEPAAVKTPVAAPSGPRIGLRESVDASGPEPRPRRRLRRVAIVIVVVLSVAATPVIGIVAETNRAAPKPHPTSLTAATSRPNDAGLSAAAKTGALETLTHQADKSPRQRHTVRTRHRTRGRTRQSSRRAAINRRHSTAPVATPTTTPSSSGSSSVSPASTSSYASSSSSPAYSSQPATSESAPTAAKSVPLPAGPLGPGGTVGTNCNPKCS